MDSQEKHKGERKLICYIFGGSASGKSEYAENLAVSLMSEATQTPGASGLSSVIPAEQQSAGRSRYTGAAEKPEKPDCSRKKLLYDEELLYVATMKNDSPEAAARIEKHRMQRSGKGFALREAETPEELEKCPSARVILFDCLSNFTAGVLFSEEFYPLISRRDQSKVQDGDADEDGDENGDKDELLRLISGRILKAIRRLSEKCEHLIIVSDAVFSDGNRYDPLTELYIRLLGGICRNVAERADRVEEIVFGLSWKIK